MTDPGYICGECRRPVIVRGEKIIRACEHTGTVIATMTAVATGESKLEKKD